MKAPCIVLVVLALAGFATAEPAKVDGTSKYEPIVPPKSPLDRQAFDNLTRQIESTRDGQRIGALYDDRASEYGRAGKWSEAAADFDQARTADPAHSHYWMRGGVARLLAHDPMGYQGLIESMIEQFEGTDSIYESERLAKMCALSKRTVGKQAFVEGLIDQAVRESGESPWAEYFPSTQAIVLYRYGKYDKALEAVAASEEINETAKSQDVTAINAVVAALCHARLGNAEKARTALERGDKLLRQALSDRNLVRESGYWHDWMIAKLLHDEARQVLAEAEASP